MSILEKDREWLEELKSRTKKLRERAEKKPEPEKIPVESKKPTLIDKDEYLEIKEEGVIEKKPEVTVNIEKENHYAIIKPIIDENKTNTKEELNEEKIKNEKLLQIKEIEKNEVPKETETIEEKKIEKIEKSIEAIKTEEVKKEILIDMIETDIDKLMKTLNEKKSISIGDLSKTLKISIDRLENWAKILEDHGLIVIEYPIIGLPKLRKKEWKKES